MAFKISYTAMAYGQQINFSDAYAEVVFITTDKTSLDAQVIIYTNEDKSAEIERKSYRIIPDVTDTGKNPFKQVYEHLKTLPEFVGAVDVLEDGQTA